MKKLSRRAMLRGAGGAVVSLPFLEAMLGANQTAAQAAAVPKRVVFFFTSCGVNPSTFWPSGGETDFELSASLAPLAPLRDKILIADGIRMDTATNDRVSGNGHDKGTAHCLTARDTVAGPSGRGEFGHLWDGSAGGISIDQHIAASVGGATPYASLEFGVRAEGIAQALPSRISYTGSFQPVIPMNDAGQAFDRLFLPLAGDGAAARALAARRARVLDYTRGELGRLSGRVGAGDRARLGEHASAIESLGRQLEGVANAACEIPERGTSNQYADLGALQMNLLTHALKCDLTRVASIQWSTGQSGARIPGMQDSHHGVSHKSESEVPSWDGSRTYGQLSTEIDRFYAEQLAHLLSALDSVTEADG
ncbi:MAG: DUF1552 domain-containing protein, partial [Sandaracinaceae bacterium]